MSEEKENKENKKAKKEESNENNESKKEDKKEVKKVTFGSIFAWLFGGLMLLVGVSALFTDFIAGVLALIAAIIVLPPLNKRILEEKLNIQLSTGLKIIIVIILFALIGAAIPSEELDNESVSNESPQTETNTEKETESNNEEVVEDDEPITDNTQENESSNSQDEYDNNAQEYFLEVANISNNVTDGMNYIAQISTNKPNPASWTSEEISDAAYYSVLIESAYDNAKEVTPPKEYEYGHSLFLKGLKKYKEAMPIWRSGIDNFNTTKIEQAASLITEGNSYINKASQELEKFNLEL